MSADDRLPRVLLVEDDPAFGRLMQWVLDGIAELERVETSEEVSALVSERWPDLILSDLNLPTVTGVELFKELQSDEGASGLPFALLTGSMPMDEDTGPLREARDAGITNILYKDLGLDGLRKAVQSMIDEHLGD